MFYTLLVPEYKIDFRKIILFSLTINMKPSHMCHYAHTVRSCTAVLAAILNSDVTDIHVADDVTF